MEWQAFVGIIAIIGIVIVVGALIAFVGHMIVGAFDNGDRAAAKTNQPTEVMDYAQYKQQEHALLNAQQTAAKDYDFNAIDMAKAKKEQELLQDNKDEDLFKLVDDNDADLESIENRLKSENETTEPAEPSQTAQFTESDAEDININDLIDQINNEVVDEEKEKAEDQVEEENPILSAYSIDDILKQTNSDTDEDEGEEPQEVELPEEESKDEADEEADEQTDSDEELEDSKDETEADKEEVTEQAENETVTTEDETPAETKAEDDEALKLANQRIAELTSQLENLNKQLSEKPAVVTTEVVTLDMTEDECLARIAVLEERLKNAKKDYKINMKEYRPLKKVMNDLERYQTKLRRKEAIVAKKKVALYGVNNYVDIDKEKAEKLANELELLDGLRLSVNHCEDVINANKDRFPILEHTNSILEEQIAQLEQDLELANTTLAKIRERQGEGENNQ